MKLFSFQPTSLVSQIHHNRFIFPNFIYSEYSRYLDFQQAYDFLGRKFHHRLKSLDHSLYASQVNHYLSHCQSRDLFWAWASPPSADDFEFPRTYHEYTFLTLEVPEHLLILSDFDAWHFVLNRSPLVWPDQYSTSSSILAEDYLRFEHLSYFFSTQSHRDPQLYRHFESQWNHIFQVIPDLQSPSLFSLVDFNENLEFQPGSKTSSKAQACLPFFDSQWIISSQPLESFNYPSSFFIPYQSLPAESLLNGFCSNLDDVDF